MDDDTRTESSFEPFNKTPNFEIRPLSGDIQAIEQVFQDAKASVSDSILPGFFSNDFGDDDDDDDDISVINMDFWVIPHGWEEYFDEDSQTPYYLNTITQVTSSIAIRLGIVASMICGYNTHSGDTMGTPGQASRGNCRRRHMGRRRRCVS